MTPIPEGWMKTAAVEIDLADSPPNASADEYQDWRASVIAKHAPAAPPAPVLGQDDEAKEMAEVAEEYGLDPLSEFERYQAQSAQLSAMRTALERAGRFVENATNSDTRTELLTEIYAALAIGQPNSLVNNPTAHHKTGDE